MPRRPDLAALEATLEGALVDATGGDPWGAPLEGRLRTVVRHHLLRAGLGAAQVDVRLEEQGVVVRVALPPEGPRVRQLVLNLGSPR